MNAAVRGRRKPPRPSPRREELDEKLAPGILRKPILTPDGNVLVGARVTVENGRIVRANGLPDQAAIRNLAQNSPMFGDRHYAAARQITRVMI